MIISTLEQYSNLTFNMITVYIIYKSRLNKLMNMKKTEAELIWENWQSQNIGVSEELDRGDEVGDYLAFLKNMAQELVKNDMPEETAMENVLSHPFEETYGEYIRARGAAGVYTAAVKHKELAEKMGVYHEVDMDALQNWKYVS